MALYKTFKEARKAAREIGFTGAKDYINRAKEVDRRLPIHPERGYLKDFISWADYLGKKAPEEKYSSFEEARSVARKQGFKNASDYKKRCLSVDPRLPVNPNTSYEDHFVDWYDFLGTKRKQGTIYKTYEEAKKALKRLSIASQSDYRRRYKHDQFLPSTPEEQYGETFLGWFDFLGKQEPEIFSTYSEAREAARKHSFLNVADYKARRKELDPRMPAQPSTVYRDEFISWYDYLGTKIPPHARNAGQDDNDSYYTCYETARREAQKHNFTSHVDYNQRRHEVDSKLPKYLKKWFKHEYVDDNDFFGIPYPIDVLKDKLKLKGISELDEYIELASTSSAYPNSLKKEYGINSFKEFLEFELWEFKKAIEYCHDKKIKTADEYIRHAREEIYLPDDPRKIKGYTSHRLLYYRPDALESTLDEYPELETYLVVAQKYALKGRNLTKKQSLIKRFLIDYILDNHQPLEPAKLLMVGHKVPNLDHFIDKLAVSDKSTNTLRIIQEYCDQLLLEYCADIDEETGEVVYLNGFRNPFKKHELEDPWQNNRSETNKAILPFEYIIKLRKHICPTEARYFCDLKNAIKYFNLDYYEVDPSIIDKDDPNCVWRTREVYRNNEKITVHQMWSPVRTIALYTLFQLPLRGLQILWNDSGEADSQIPVISNGKIRWVTNKHRLAGTAKKPQGFIFNTNQIATTGNENDGFGFFATTNKTRTLEGGYSVPYMPEELAHWLIKLRDWQMKYNPISKSSLWESVNIKVDKKRLKKRGNNGKQCFLFRNPKEKSDLLKGLPTTTGIFNQSIPILLYNIQDKSLPLATYKKTSAFRRDVPHEYSSDYTAHSFRASLITALILDCGVAVPIVSKLVGHANIVMSIYYAKVAEKEIRRNLDEAEAVALKKSRDRVDNAIYTNKLKEIDPFLVDNENGGFLESIGNSLSQLRRAMLLTFDYGICPVAGSRCHEGGEKASETGTIFLPVQSGYLGKQNCLRCRFFVTGAPFLGGLKALADEISLEANIAAKNMNEAQEEIDRLEDLFFEQEDNFTEQSELSRMRNLYVQRAAKFDELTTDLIHVFRLSDAVVKLLNQAESSKEKGNMPLLANHHVELEIDIEEVSHFRSLDTVCKNAELYAFSDASRAIPTRSQMIDAMAHVNDIKCQLYNLNEKQQLTLGNQITRLLLDRLGDWERFDNVITRQNKLSDFIGQGEIMQIKHDVISLADNSTKDKKVLTGK